MGVDHARKTPTKRLEDWGFAPCEISPTSKERRDTGDCVQFVWSISPSEVIKPRKKLWTMKLR